MKTCQRCGMQMEDTSVICPRCGCQYGSNNPAGGYNNGGYNGYNGGYYQAPRGFGFPFMNPMLQSYSGGAGTAFLLALISLFLCFGIGFILAIVALVKCGTAKIPPTIDPMNPMEMSTLDAAKRKYGTAKALSIITLVIFGIQMVIIIAGLIAGLV